MSRVLPSSTRRIAGMVVVAIAFLGCQCWHDATRRTKKKVSATVLILVNNRFQNILKFLFEYRTSVLDFLRHGSVFNGCQ